MCIAILNRQKTLSKNTIIHSFENNPDGIGMAYADKGKIQTVKRMNDPAGFYNLYKAIRERTKTPIFIHARIGTSGTNDLKNVHPFKITKKLVMMHNGIISYPKLFTQESDTRHLVRFIQSFRNPASVLDQSSIEYGFIDQLAGSSKFIFMNTEGDYSIINEGLGHWDADGDTWYSNETYKKVSYKMYGNKKVYNSCNYGQNWGYQWGDYKPKTMKKEARNETLIQKQEQRIIEAFTNLNYWSMKDYEVVNGVSDCIDAFGIAGSYYEAIAKICEELDQWETADAETENNTKAPFKTKK